MVRAAPTLTALEPRAGPAVLAWAGGEMLVSGSIPVDPIPRVAAYDLPPFVGRDDAWAGGDGVPVTAHGPVLPGVLERVAAAAARAPRVVPAAVGPWVG